MEKIKRWQTWVLIIICVTINNLGRNFALNFHLPIWLDSVGTIVAAIELGALGGGICGAITNTIMFVTSIDVASLPYMVVSVCLGILIGLFFPRKKPGAFVVCTAAVTTGLIAALVSSPLNLVIFDGKTGNMWGDAVIDMISHGISVPIINTFIAEFFIDFPDKTLSFFAALGIIRISKKAINIFKPKAIAGIVIIPLVLSIIPSDKALAVDFASEYTGEVYDTEDGLESVEINAVEQTDDGYIWVGTYSGIYRYDGHMFYPMKLDARIKNVMDLFVDSKGNLWIGTNDTGVACYNPEYDTIVFYTVQEGLSSNSVRAITEDSKGNILVATISDLCLLNKNRELSVFKEKSLHGIEKLSSSGNMVGAIKSDGTLILIEEGKVRYYFAGNYSAIDASEGGNFVFGTTSNISGILTVREGRAEISSKYYSDTLKYFNNLAYSVEYGGYFVCCENGVGFINKKGVVTDMTSMNFNTSVDDCLIDYQGNIWFASSKQGIMRFTWNPFEDLFSRAEIMPEVTNTCLIKDGLLYAATGSGLVTIDLKTFYSVPIPKPQYLKNIRIRHIMNDSKGNLWFSTYSDNGLIELKTDDSIKTFNSKSGGAEGDRFRLCKELSDGRIVAVSNSGVNFIRDERIVTKLGEQSGISAPVLCVMEDTKSGRIFMGSDGSGIYVVENNKIVDCIDEDDGLNSLVVMKIIPCQKGYLYVTSNSLYYAEEGVIKRLENFPYNNNYDVFNDGKGNAWVMSSAGIFIVNELQLIGDGDYNYRLLNRNSGLRGSLTANSYYDFSGGKLYLCCTDGARRIDLENYDSYNKSYKIKISDLIVGDRHIKPFDGVYHIPATTGRIQFDVAILNYTMSNPYIHIFLEGVEDQGIYCYQNSMQNLIFTNLQYGRYILHVQVYDSSGTTLQREETFVVEKDSMLYERPYFKVYFYLVCAALVLYIGWAIGYLIQNANNLERWQNAATTDPLTGLLNKRGAETEFTRACSYDTGILMILDLDSFKPVNDIYGHAMGDKILMIMAQLLKTCTREEDLLCRIGGDEFVAFLRNATREVVVDDKTRFLNNEILKAAKTYLGKDMKIPIGVSIGAVMVPEEGTDFHELFAKADKALYEAKDKGKHAYAIFSSSEGSKSSVISQSSSGGLTGLKKIMSERGPANGAYHLDYNSMEDVYRIIKRLSLGGRLQSTMIHFEISSEGAIKDEDVKKLADILAGSLSDNDIVCIDGIGRVLAIVFPEDNTGSLDLFAQDIISKWKDETDKDKYSIKYDIGKI